MNFNSRLLKEAKELGENWESVVLGGLEDTFERSTVAVHLESQRLFNEIELPFDKRLNNAWLKR